MAMQTSHKAIIGVAILGIVLYFVTRPKAAPALPPAPPNPAPPPGPSPSAPADLRTQFLSAIQRYSTTPAQCTQSGPTVTLADGSSMQAMALCTATLRPNGASDPSVATDLQALADMCFDIWADPGIIGAIQPATARVAAIQCTSNVTPPAGMQRMFLGKRGMGAIPSGG